mgnify:FL=1
MWKLPGYTDKPEEIDWDFIHKEYSWVRDMVGVIQDKHHHAEGDVFVHTKMVVTALLNLPEFKELNEQDKSILFAAALMHDVEKRSTTITDENGRVSAHGHARKGEKTARLIIYKDYPAPFEIREQVCSLVRYHGLPIWLSEREDPPRLLGNCSLVTNTHHLYILSKADMIGRICDDFDDMIFRVEMFKELCIEQNCYGKPMEFKSDLGRFKYLNEGGYVDFEPFDETKFKVTLLSGLPRSGKNEYLKSLGPVNVVCPDDIRRKNKISPTDKVGNGRVIQNAKEEAKVFMREKKDFVWNATNISTDLRGGLIDLFMSYGARVEIVYIEVPYKTLLSQNHNRDYKVPEAALERLITKLAIPSLKEGHNVKYKVS